MFGRKKKLSEDEGYIVYRKGKTFVLVDKKTKRPIAAVDEK